jgi:hypothetical protein
MYRGDVVPKDVNASVATIKTKRTIQVGAKGTGPLLVATRVAWAAAVVYPCPQQAAA